MPTSPPDHPPAAKSGACGPAGATAAARACGAQARARALASAFASAFAEVGIPGPDARAVRTHERVMHPLACAPQRGAPSEQLPAELGAVPHLAVDAHDRDGAVLASRGVDEPPAPRLGLRRGEDRVPGGGQCCSFQSAPAGVTPSYDSGPIAALTGKSQRGGTGCGTVRRRHSFSLVTP
jgi:hypothetical protein